VAMDLKVMAMEIVFQLILKLLLQKLVMNVQLDIIQMETDNAYLKVLSLNVLKDSIKIHKVSVSYHQLHVQMVINLTEMVSVYQ
jgi:hypothetical protein